MTHSKDFGYGLEIENEVETAKRSLLRNVREGSGMKSPSFKILKNATLTRTPEKVFLEQQEGS